MHYLFATWDGGGTVPIDLGVVRTLVDRGHTVTVLGDPTMAAETAAAGAAFVPWREAPHRRSTAREDDVLRDWEVRRRPVALLRRVSDRLVTGPAAAFARETAAEIDRRRPDVVLVDAAILGPMVAAEARGLPTVGIIPGCYILPTPGGPPFGLGLRPARTVLGRTAYDVVNLAVRRAWRSGLPQLNAARAEFGLAPLRDPFDQLRGCHAVLVTTAEAFDFPARLPDNVHYVGPVMADPAWAATAPVPELPADRPLVLVAFSSTFVTEQVAVLRRIVAALDSLPVTGLIGLGPAVDPADVPGTDSVHVAPAVPHGAVLPRTSVVITHGGHGSVLKPLAHGVPVLCLPAFRDQKDNAVRLTERGAGLRLRPTASADQIAAALRRLLADPAFAAAAQDLGRRIRDEIEHSPLVEVVESAGRGRG